MVYFEEFEENGQLVLHVAVDSNAMASNLTHKFPIYPSMLRPNERSDLPVLKKMFPAEITLPLNAIPKSGPAYLLKGVQKENQSEDVQLPLLGRRIARGIIRWNSSSLKISVDFAYIPLYWEWAEDIIARYSKRLKDANIYDAVYASLYQYDREPHIIRAFCESWCPTTNTLHTVAGEWSISLWDLHMIGGLPVVGRRYDEVIPSLEDMKGGKGKARLVPQTCEYLFEAYCAIAALPESKNIVSAKQWTQYWCKQKSVHKKPQKEPLRRSNSRPKSSRNLYGLISEKSLEWTAEEDGLFLGLGIVDESERINSYLAAFLSCWLCTFVLPEGEDLLIRPETFEVAALMSRGIPFSLAPPVLANIYHGLNKMVNSDKPTVSGSVFPSHYLYGWLAHYFNTHHVADNVPSVPLMIRYSGSRSAKLFTPIEARNLIHDGSLFKASILVLRANRCVSVCDHKLDDLTFSYVVSLRTAYLPLRSKSSFFLEPYHPTRFSRQFGFYQEVPGILPRDADDGYVSFDMALKYYRLLLFKNTRIALTLPGRFVNWKDKTTINFEQWWTMVTVSDLRANIQLLISSVDSKTKNKNAVADILPSKVHGEKASLPISNGKGKRGGEDSDGDKDINYKHRRVHEVQRTQDVDSCYGEEDAPMMLSPRADGNPGVVDALSSSDRTRSNSLSGAGVTSNRPPLSQIAKMNYQVIGVLLTNLLEAPSDQVKEIAGGVIGFLNNISNDGDSISTLRAAVEAYSQSVDNFFTTEQEVAKKATQYALDISEIEESLRSAQVKYNGAIQTGQSLQKTEEIVAKTIAETQTRLQALTDEAKSIKDQQRQQMEVLSLAEAEIGTLQSKLDDLKTSQRSSSDLMKAQSKLDRCKKIIKAAIT